jgi:endonuclease VIII
MPEGDSLRRAAALVTPVLEGHVVEQIWFHKLRGYRPRSGQMIQEVAAVGKHLQIHFDRNLSLDVHLGMTGYWRVAAPNAPLRPDPKLRISITTAAGHALCYLAPTVQTYIRDGAAPSPTAQLGPDLSDEHPDLELVIARSREPSNDTMLAELLLDQHVAAGVGNVFKSEALFVAGLYPFLPVANVTDAQLRHLWTVAHQQLFANRTTRMRTTTRPTQQGRYYVYGRHRLGCRRCDNAIEYSPAGLLTGRSTYWCPTCQPSPHRDQKSLRS